MSRTLVKICGVRSPEIARVVAASGANLLGLIFAESKRRVSGEEACEIVGALDGIVARPNVVGVFVNEPAERINALAERVGLDLVQLSGDEPPGVQADLERPVIRALRLPAGTALPDACRVAERYLDCAAPARALLLDTHRNGVYGGTGLHGDWRLAARLAARYPVILAGGLSPDSVVEAIQTVRPFGVDVSSGVETGGEKDPEKIRQFIRLAKSQRVLESARAGASDIVSSRR